MRFLLVSLLLIFMSAHEVAAQIEVPFNVRTVNYTTRKKESGVTVKVYDGASVIHSATSDGSGEVKLKLPAGKKYKIEVSKPGKVLRFATVNLSNVNDELIQGTSAPQGAMEMSLFDQAPGVDYSYVTSNSVTEFYYDGKNADLQYDEVLAGKMAKKIEKIMKDAEAAQGQSEAQYNALIKQADGQFTQKKYQDALASYEQALAIKPKEPHPAQRINEIDGILKAQKANEQQNAQIEQEYQNLITAADNLFNQKKFEEAKARYQEALTKKQEQHAKDQIVKCDSEIARLKKEAENAQKYNDAVKAADMFFGQKSFQAAKDKYNEALKWKADDPHSKARLTEIDGKLNAQKAEQEKKKKYEDANAAGDALMAQQKWAEAKSKYQEALTFEPSSSYSQAKIKECDTKIAEVAAEKAKQEQITKLLAEGNTAFTASQWAASKTKYEDVLKLDAENAVAKGRISEIDTKLAAEKADAEKLATIKKLIGEGDAFAKQTKLQEAKAKYEEAYALKADPAVKTKIDAVNAQIAAANEKAAQKEKYEKAMADGEAAFTAANWEGAKTKFTEAQTLDPAAAAPKQRLAEVEKKIAENLANAQKTEKYNAAMTAGNAAMASGDLAAAKTKYQEATAIDGTKQEAKDKLAQVNQLIADAAAKQANQAKYDAAVKAGGDLLAAGKLTEAKAKFTEAQALDPGQALPKQKIAEIETLQAAAEKQKQVEALLKEGDAALAKKDVVNARSKYQQVLTLDPSNSTASAKLQEVAKLENDLAGEAQKEARFKQLKEEAGTLIAQEKFQEAKQKLLEAKTIRTDEQVDKMIVQCDAKIAEQKANAEKEKQYNALVAEAQGLESAKQYDQAIAKYNEALKIKNESLPKERIAAIIKLKEGDANQLKYEAAMKAGNDLLAAEKLNEAKAKFEEAQKIDPSQTAPQQKIAEINNRLAAADKNKQYNALVAEAQGLESAKQYDQAIAKYNDALKLKNEQLPKDRIAAINQIKSANANQAKIDADYAAAIKRGDDLFNSGSFTDAIKAYNDALAIKPTEKEPVDKAEKARLAAQKESGDSDEAKYQKILSTGQKYMDEKNYERAKELFNRALSFRATDPIPKQKLVEIAALEKAAEESKRKLEAYNAKMTEAEKTVKSGNLEAAITQFEQAKNIKPDESMPDTRIAELRAQLAGRSAEAAAAQQRYTELMAQGAAAALAKDYSTALLRYKEALGVKPNDKAAQDKITEMQQLLDNEAKAKARQEEISKLIGKADAKFDGKKWMDAKQIYDKVVGIDPSNVYAQNRIQECIANAKREVGDEVEREYQKVLAKADENFDAKNYDRAKDLYNRALSFRATDPYPKQRLAEIDAILNPKPVVAQKEPEKLKNLGTPTDNSILEGQAALQQAEVQRKSRRSRRLRKQLDYTTEKTDSLMAAQAVTATETNVALNKITKENAASAVQSDEKRQGNVESLNTIKSDIQSNDEQNDRFKTAERLNAKSQIELANRTASEQNGVLDGNAFSNNEVLKTSRTAVEDSNGKVGQGAYQQRLDNEKEYMSVQLTLEQNAIDDTQERLATEEIIREANRGVVRVTDENQQRTNQTLEAVKSEVEDVTAEIAQKRYEETRQSPLNKEEILKIELLQSERNQQDNDEHLQNTLTYRSYIEGVDVKIEEASGQRDIARQNNVEVMKGAVADQEEVERGNYNALVVRTMQNKGTISNEVQKADQYASLPASVGEENTGKINRINVNQQEADRQTVSQQTEKYQSNKAIIGNAEQTVAETATGNSERPKENAMVISGTKSSLGATEQKQSQKQEDKTQAAKQLLAAIEKKEIVYNEQVANDLGKLYPEGVSQEQFEQYDEEGLLKAVVTRRIVVRNGHGDIYVRIQKLNGITYSKNNQPATEYVWQRETQDATLTRNY